MRLFEGCSPYRGYALGPALVFSGWPSVIEVRTAPVPVILAATYIEPKMLDFLDLARIRGIVVERGSVIDPLFEPLAELARPSVIGALGLLDAVRPGETLIVDGAEGRVIAQPDDEAIGLFTRLRGLRPPREDPRLREVVRRLALAIREARLRRHAQPPYDLPGQRRLFEIADKVVRGERPTESDDAWVRSLMES